MQVVQKSCPGCGAAVGWPVGASSVACPGCAQRLMLETPVKRSTAGQKIMVVGLSIVALAFVIAVLSAL